MKVSAPTLGQAVTAEKSWVAVYADLFKARLTTLVLLTTMLGFYLGAEAPDYLLMFHAVAGMALVAAGGAALNELFERDFDALMRRTRERPLPSGRLQPHTVFWIGWVTALLGVVYLVVAVNVLTGVLAAFTLFTYLFVYTPLKRRSPANTLVGAIPGALPPVIGWVAARGTLGWEAVTLFAIQAFWQIPHFMAIAWIYREEYARAGFQMVPVLDPEGIRTSRQALWFTIALFLAGLAPWAMHLAGQAYLLSAIALGGIFVGFAVAFARRLTISSARHLFYASILYLPLLLLMLAVDKTRG